MIIGKDRKVQVVHVGLEPGLENRLSEEPEALLNGKDLAAETLAKAEANHEESAPSPATQGVQVAWSVDGPWVGLTVDQAVGRIHGVDVDGNVTIFDSQGAPQRKLQLKDAGTIVRSANLIGGPPAELITFQPWGQDVRAYSEDGTQLWAYSLGQGVDDVWAADLNNDKRDEVIIGYNGSTGLHVLDNQGKPLWTYTKIGNVWHVCAEDLNGDGKREVLTTSATGQLSSACAPEDIGCRNSWIFRRLVARRVFVEAKPGRYYLDELAASEFVRVRRSRLLRALVVVLALCALLVLFTSLL